MDSHNHNLDANLQREFVARARQPTQVGPKFATLYISVTGKILYGASKCQPLCPTFVQVFNYVSEALDCGEPIIR